MQNASAIAYRDEREALLAILPGRVRLAVEKHPEKNEISMLLGRPLTLSTGTWDEPPISFPEILIREDEIDFVTAKLSGIKTDGRAGIDGTAHRVSVIFDRYRQVIGLTIRIARWVEVLDPETAKAVLENRGSVLIIGAPGTGKTTLLRNIVALLARRLGPHLSVIDTSNEIGGLGRIPHPALETARWFQVPHPKEQAEIIRRAIANHAPLVLVLDEVGYNDDVEEVEAAARRGIQVISSVHGRDLLDVLENPVYASFLGRPDRERKKRLNRPSFRSAIEVRGKNKLYLIPDLAQALDDLLAGRPPRGVQVGSGWAPGERAYPETPAAAGETKAAPDEAVKRICQALANREAALAQAAGKRGMNAAKLKELVVLALAGDAGAASAIQAIAEELK